MVEENMIPEGWEQVPLWQLTAWDKHFNSVERFKQERIVKYHYFLANELQDIVSDAGTVKILTTNKTDLWAIEDNVRDYVSDGEVVAIPWGGTPIVQYYHGKFITGDNRIATSLDTDVLDNKYLYYAMLYQLPLISTFYRGSGLKHPDMNNVLDLEIPVPTLPEQRRIAAVLSDLDDYIEKQEKLIEKNKKFRDGVLEELIPVYIESTTNDNQYQQVSKIVRTNVPPYKIPKTEYEQSGDFPIIDQGQIFISGYTNDVSQCFNDGCYILFGDHTCVLKYIEHAFAQGADGLKVLSSVDEQNYLPKYIYYAMNTVDIPPSYDRHWGTMSDAKVFVPPFPEQQRIASVMSDLDDNIAKQQTKLDKARKLKDALLNDLISGKIRLTDDE